MLLSKKSKKMADAQAARGGMNLCVFSLGSYGPRQSFFASESTNALVASRMRTLDDVASDLFKISCGPHIALLLTSTGSVYTLEGSECALTQVPPAHFLNEEVVDVAVGDAHFVSLTVGGSVLTWGRNDKGQCGLGNTLPWVATPAMVCRGVHVITAIAAGANHTVLLTDKGTVLTCGNGDFGQLGHNNRGIQLIPHLVKPLFGTRISQIAASNNVTVTISEAGTLFVWGEGTLGALGLGNNKAVMTPRHLTLPTLAGKERTAVKQPPALYGTIESYLHPRRIRLLAPPAPDPSCGVMSVTIAQSHTVYLDAAGRLFATGINTKGQLGIGRIPKSDAGTTIEYRNAVNTLVSVPLSSPGVAVSASNDCTMAQTVDGELFFWGAVVNEDGHEYSSTKPVRVDKATLVGATKDSTVVIKGVYPHPGGYFFLAQVQEKAA